MFVFLLRISLLAHMGRASFPKASPKGSTEKGKSAAKVPSAADLADAKVGSSRNKPGTDGHIHIYEVFFCDDGSVYGEGFSGEMVALHLVHDYPSVWFLFLQSLTAYCESRHREDATYPET